MTASTDAVSIQKPAAGFHRRGPGVLRPAAGADYYRSMARAQLGRGVSTSLRLLGPAALLLLVLVAPCAQEGAPFVSRLRLSSRDPEVRLSWQDAPGAAAGGQPAAYLVLRSTEALSAETLDRATRVASVAPGIQSFIDVPELPGSYHYAVLAVGPDGHPVPDIVPGRNATDRPIRIENVASLRERAATVRGLQAAVVTREGQGAVRLTFTADRLNRELVVYRSTAPIRATADLGRASVVDRIESATTSVTDLPVPGVPYHYAVADSALVLSEEMTFTAGQNVTALPVEIPLAARAAQTTVPLRTAPASGGVDQPAARAEAAPPLAAPTADAPTTVAPTAVSGATTGPAPTATPAAVDPQASATESASVAPGQATAPDRSAALPFLALTAGPTTGARLDEPRVVLPSPSALDQETRLAVDTILAMIPRRAETERAVTILPDDLLAGPLGAEYTLRTILDGPMARLAWEEALLQLGNFFTLPLDAELAARAHFYRGQVYYFLGDDRRAVMELLLARDRYYAQVTPWLDHVLRRSAR